MTTLTDKRGAFSVGSRKPGLVRVSTAGDIWADRFAPESIEVPSGTTELVFRRVKTVPLSNLTIKVVERGTLARIPWGMVLGFRETAREDWSFHPAHDGLVTIELKLNEDVCLAFEAEGYRRRELRAASHGADADESRALSGGTRTRACALAPRARGRRARGAHPGSARARRERLVATTDGDGRASIELPDWPAELVVTAAGHAEGLWTCKDWLAELGDGVVWLQRKPADSAGD